MTARGSLVLALALAAIGAGVATAGPLSERAATLRGIVETATSRWAGDTIVTDVTVRAADGTRVTVTEHGGSVGGIGMSVSHHDANLRAGDVVEVVSVRDRLRAHRVSTTRVAARVAPDEGDVIAGYGVQRTLRSNRPLYHATGCLSFQYDAKGSAKLEGEWAAFDAAFSAWQAASATSACSGLNFHHELVANAPEGVDGISTIRFRDDRWCRPAIGSEPELCHSPDAVAVTRVVYVDDPLSPRDGEILEVDIEVNAVDFALAVDGRTNAVDLASAAAHEIGHALGLDHNCGIEGATAWPIDESGTPVPSCEAAPQNLVDATMYFQVPPGVTTMRSPEATDVEGLCSVVQARCVGEITGGCSVAGPDASAGGTRTAFPIGVPIALLVLGLVVRRRRD